jgi:hypothetical protein
MMSDGCSKIDNATSHVLKRMALLLAPKIEQELLP